MNIFFEELSLNAWPALQTKLYDGWLLRFANGYTKRSNSISPLYPSRLPLDEKIRNCEFEYQKQKMVVTFKLTEDQLELDHELANRNYSRLDETSVRALKMQDYQNNRPLGIVTEDILSDSWFQDWINCSTIQTPKLQQAAHNILQNINGDRIGVRKKVNGETVGCGFGVIEREHMGLFDIVVSKDYRSKGYGRDIVNGILCAAISRKVKVAYLSVVVGNTHAENLYQSIGFQEIYRYWYRQKKFSRR